MDLTVFNTKRDQLATRTKWGIGLVAAVVVAPLTWLVAQAVLGLAALGGALALAAVVGLGVINGAPVVSMKFANWKLRALKQEAERNPIETLQAQQIELESGLQKEAAAITNFDGEVETYRCSLQNELSKGFAEAAASGLPTLRNMERLLAFRRTKFKRAQASLKERRKKVELAESSYRVALAAQRVTAASGETQSNVLTKILEDIAFASVDKTVNLSMAELRTAIMVEEIPADDKDADAIEGHATLITDGTSELDLNQLQHALQMRGSAVYSSEGV